MDGVGFGPVHPAVGVGSEVIALRLQQVGGEGVPAVAVVVGQRRAEGWRGYPELDGLTHDAAPGGLVLIDRLPEERIQQEVVQAGIVGEGIPDALEEAGPDDAASPPHQGDAAVIELPIVFLGGGPDQGVALGVGADLRAVESLFNRVD